MNINELSENVDSNVMSHRDSEFDSHLIAAAILEVKNSIDALTAQITFFENTVAQGMGRR